MLLTFPPNLHYSLIHICLIKFLSAPTRQFRAVIGIMLMVFKCAAAVLSLHDLPLDEFLHNIASTLIDVVRNQNMIIVNVSFV